MTTEIIFPGLVPGHNGRGGLQRSHWAKIAQLKKSYLFIAKLAKQGRHTGPVRFELIRHSTSGRKMDYDNLVSTGKLITDAIVKAGILPDDNPACIVERHYSQTKALNKTSQMTVIRITDIDDTKNFTPT